MSVALLLPAIFAVGCATVAGLIRWPLRPMLAVRILTATAVVVGATVSTVLVAVAVGFAARSALLLSFIEWCPIVPLHHHVSYLEGSTAILALAVGGVRARRVLRRRRWAAEGTAGRHLSILDSDEPVAYAAPGDPGCVVVSRGLLDALEPRERQVVLAHERAHLYHRHHRYLLASELTVAFVPLLRPLALQICLATERSADESAASALGGDRGLVARTIARAAITRSVHDGLVGAIGGGSTTARVNALIGPPHTPPVVMLALGAVATTATMALAAGSMEIYNLVGLIGHLCHI
jgi:Zn-dependent protease with chaperone function